MFWKFACGRRGFAGLGLACALTIAVALVPTRAQAHRSYVSRIPNGSVHSCSSCHASSGRLTAFGSAYRSNSSWAVLGLLDSDGDGQSNGQELGDPCHAWPTNTGLLRTVDISDPGYASSTSGSPDTPSCEVAVPDAGEDPPPDAGQDPPPDAGQDPPPDDAGAQDFDAGFGGDEDAGQIDYIAYDPNALPPPPLSRPSCGCEVASTLGLSPYALSLGGLLFGAVVGLRGRRRVRR